jgi:hypothetical protein
MHSANYEEGYVLDGKKVAVIGAGSSGVQIVAAIQKKVDTLYHWIRRFVLAKSPSTPLLTDIQSHLDNSRLRPTLGRPRRRKLQIHPRTNPIPKRKSKEIPRIPQTNRKRIKPTLQIYHSRFLRSSSSPRLCLTRNEK